VPEEWRYEPLSDVEKPLADSLRDFPREPHIWAYAVRSTCALAIRGWLRAVHRFAVVGRENLPDVRSCVVVANHSSHWDALCLLSALPLGRIHRAFPAAAADYFFTNFTRTAFAALVVNALPFDRHAGARGSLAFCQAALAKPGNIVILFPEGTRSADGTMGAFKPGIGLLLAGTDTTVVPCYIRGAYRSWPRSRALPRPGRLSVAVGEPRSFSDRPRGKESALAIAAELREAVHALEGSCP
jgi:1-acyl-sn-glycerol-3-phosphate acyltransferase